MSKTSSLYRELKKIETCKRYKKKRSELKAKLSGAMIAGDMDEVMALQLALQKLPRNASPTRVRRRCRITGRARGTYRKVGLSKGMFRLIAMRGEIPGLMKASW